MKSCPKIVFSFDFELGWGVLDSPIWKHREEKEIYTNLRPIFDSLVQLLHETKVPTTWAIVSSLLAKSERDINIDHLPVSYQNSVTRFYRESEKFSHCGLDLIDKLESIDSLIEIASHTSTHIYGEYQDILSEQYVEDVRISIEVLESYFSRPITSLVFPRDQANFNNEIAKKFPLNFRLNPSYGDNTSKMGRMISGASRIYKMPPHSKIIMGQYGENYQTGSLYFNWSGGSYERIKKALTKIQVNRMLSDMHNESIYHIWLHPFNLAESSQHFSMFAEFIRNIAELRDKGLIEIVTMEDVKNNGLKEIGFNG